jgi:GrpB-like predicted nucleotidyltransferase (UPF0157 family)
VTRLDIVEPRVSWPAEFEMAAERLRAAFGSLALRIDHIGSTCVPGLPAKDVIDIQVAVASLTPAGPIREALAATGLTVVDHVVSDHEPPGARGGADEWTKLLAMAPATDGVDGGRGSPQLNVHVRVLGRANQRYALLFRDYLCADSAVAASYALIKRALAHHVPGNFDAYYDVKDPVCDLIMASAERWAADTGWVIGPADQLSSPAGHRQGVQHLVDRAAVDLSATGEDG